MKIKSSELPALDSHSKRLINDGKIFLYKISETQYALEISQGVVYLLDREGLVIGQLNKPFIATESVYFSDISFPPSVESTRAACV